MSERIKVYMQGRINCLHNTRMSERIKVYMQGRIQDFKLRGAQLKKMAPSGGRRENIWGIMCEKSRLYAKKSYFFQF